MNRRIFLILPFAPVALQAASQIDILDVSAEWNRCKRDPIYFIETYYQEYDYKTDALTTRKLYPWQRRIVDLYIIGEQSVDETEKRQSGKSFIQSAMMLHRLMFGEDVLIGMAAARNAIVRKRIEAMQAAYGALPQWMRTRVSPRPGVGTLQTINLSNGNRVITGYQSDSFRGYRMSDLFVDEYLYTINRGDDFRRLTADRSCFLSSWVTPS